eukprot:4305947-Prymnesium_polylepis.2
MRFRPFRPTSTFRSTEYDSTDDPRRAVAIVRVPGPDTRRHRVVHADRHRVLAWVSTAPRMYATLTGFREAHGIRFRRAACGR